MKRLLYMVTVPISARAFFPDQLKFFQNNGFDVHLASSPSPEQELLAVANREGVQAHAIPMKREIAPIHDLQSLFATWKFMRQLRPSITNLGTPKAGLIGGIAAVLSRVPVRIYTLHGLRLETARGLTRFLLIWMERLACLCAHRVVCVGPSLRDRAIQFKLFPSNKAVVLRNGTCNGIDVQRFMSLEVERQSEALRKSLNIPFGNPVIGFVGRLVRDKGISDLIEAFKIIHATDSSVHLLLLGNYEDGDPVPASVRQYIETHSNIIQPGFVSDTAPYYHLMDVMAFPTYREGFPTSPLEAAAAKKPVVATDATGVADAVLDKVTGYIVPIGDVNALSNKLQQLLTDRSLSQKFGQAGYDRVLRDFQPQMIWQELYKLYNDLSAESYTRRIRIDKNIKIVIRITAIGTVLYTLANILKKSSHK